MYAHKTQGLTDCLTGALSMMRQIFKFWLGSSTRGALRPQLSTLLCVRHQLNTLLCVCRVGGELAATSRAVQNLARNRGKAHTAMHLAAHTAMHLAAHTAMHLAEPLHQAAEVRERLNATRVTAQFSATLMLRRSFSRLTSETRRCSLTSTSCLVAVFDWA